ncbi:MAG: CHC2 zinc finger domain-containing protein, partial [Paraclostridium sp.]
MVILFRKDDMMFPQPFIQQVKNTSMLDLAKRYTELKKAGDGIWQGRCPHPEHNDSTPSFVIWEKTNSWCCMGCHNGKKGQKNFGSDTIAFIQWVENLKWRDAVLKLAEINDINKPSEANDKIYKENMALAKKYVSTLFNQSNTESLDYLYNRGLDRKDVLFWGLGFDSYQARIVFPLFDKYKNVVGFNRRLIHVPPGCGDKYKNSSNSKIFNKSKYLYGIHTVDPSYPYLRVTEGCMDVIL